MRAFFLGAAEDIVGLLYISERVVQELQIDFCRRYLLLKYGSEDVEGAEVMERKGRRELDQVVKQLSEGGIKRVLGVCDYKDLMLVLTAEAR